MVPRTYLAWIGSFSIALASPVFAEDDKIVISTKLLAAGIKAGYYTEADVLDILKDCAAMPNCWLTNNSFNPGDDSDLILTKERSDEMRAIIGQLATLGRNGSDTKTDPPLVTPHSVESTTSWLSLQTLFAFLSGALLTLAGSTLLRHNNRKIES